MSLNLDVVIDAEENAVDMKSALETMQGASDAVRTISETLINGRVPERQNHKSSVRTMLKKSFTGSYGHIFSVEFLDNNTQRRYQQIGRSSFCELLSFFLNDAMYMETNAVSLRAERVLNGLGELSEELVNQLRTSAVKNIHDYSEKFGCDVKIRYRKNRDDQRVLATFNQETALGLAAAVSNAWIDITAAVTRLNIHTGNGRLLVSGEEETVAFGFNNYRTLGMDIKKSLSANLDTNNGRNSKNYANMTFRVSPMRRPDNKVVKYIVNGVLGNE